MFDLTPTQIEMVEKVRQFGKDYIMPNKGKFDEGIMPDEVANEWFRQGFGILVAPEHCGGIEYDSATVCAVYEELGKFDLAFATTFGSNNIGSYPLLIAGTLEQQKKHFELLTTPEYRLTAFALTEPGAGSDAGAVSTTAVLEGDEYVLNGTKCYITSSGVAVEKAAYITVFASTDRSKGSKGLSCFIVRGGTPGLIVSKVEEKMGIRASNTCELILENVRVPKENLIGELGQGFAIAMKTLENGRLVVASHSVGAGQSILDTLINYAKNRMDGDKPISTQQAVAFRIGELSAKLEAGRQMVRRGAYLKDNGQPLNIHSAKTKLFVTETVQEIAREAMDIMGYTGYSTDNTLGMQWRDAIILPIYEGTNQIQRLIISGDMLRK